MKIPISHDPRIFDTDVLTLFQLGYAEVVRRVLAWPNQELAITVISVEEQLSGWYTLLRRAKKADQMARVYQRLAENVESLARFRILPFTETAIAKQRELSRIKLNIGKKDLCIAAIALEQNAIIVTRNLSDFSRIPGLLVEDWSK
jgi:tRNA(fMet)-specific endonuclease VapC